MAHNQQKNQSIDPEMKELIESVDKNFQTAIINMLKDSKEYMKTNQTELLEIQKVNKYIHIYINI